MTVKNTKDVVKENDSVGLGLVAKDKQESIEDLFHELVIKGYVTKDVKLSNNLTVTIHPLNASEKFSAEALRVATFDGMPYDVIQQIRSISTLSYAINAVNGIDISDNSDMRLAINKQLNEIPIVVVENLQIAYNDLVMSQNSIFDDDKDVTEQIENF